MSKNKMTKKNRRGLALAFNHFVTGSSFSDFVADCAAIRASDNGARNELLQWTTWMDCFQCGSEIEMGVDAREWKPRKLADKQIGTNDHLIPEVEGKDHAWENQVVTCLACNKAKGTQSWESFYSDTQMIEAWKEAAPQWKGAFHGIFKKVRI
jgi:hypothetical protein